MPQNNLLAATQEDRDLFGAPFFVNGGNLSNRQSAIYALAEWANSCERRLLGLSCGYVLPRERHIAWAENIVSRCKFLMKRGSSSGAILTPWFAPETPPKPQSIGRTAVTDQQALLNVIQADTDAAVNAARDIYMANSDVLCGADVEAMEDALTEAFAAHRLSTTADLTRQLAEVREALAAINRVLLPIDMQFAQAECIDEPIPDEAVVLHFMGSGASDQVTAGEYRASKDAIRRSLTSKEEHHG